MIVYEVTAIVRADLTEAYERYMRGRHIPDLLATGYFDVVSFDRGTPGRYRIRYESPSEEALEKYLNEHAARLRADFADHFPEGIDLAREVWTTLERQYRSR